MKTFSNGFKRATSILLVVMMIFSLCTLAITSAGAANVDLADTGWTGSENFYLQTNLNNWTNTKLTNNGNQQWTIMLDNVSTSSNLQFRLYEDTWNQYAYSSNTSPLDVKYTTDFGFKAIFEKSDPSYSEIKMSNFSSYSTVDVYFTFYGDNDWVNIHIKDGVSGSGGGSGSTTEQTVFFVQASGWNNVNMYAWDSNKNDLCGAWPGTAVNTIVTDTSGTQWYQVTVPAGAVGIIFNNGTLQTVDITDFSDMNGFSLGGKNNEGKYNVTKTDIVNVAPVVESEFWVDLVPGVVSPTNIDLLYPELHKEKSNQYFLYLPAHADASALEFHISEGANITLGGTALTEGKVIDALSYVNSSNGYALGGDFSGTLYIRKSSSVPAIYTNTSKDMPQGTYQGYEHKDDYSIKNGEIKIVNADGSVLLDESVLSKLKGRGNSSWEASHKLIGKYAYNITLDSKVKLLDESGKSKKYCLVSYNADEARMRNMLVYELAQQIGVDYVADYQPVDLYNNGYYMGSYLLTDKVEIGSPLVDIVKLDKINEELTDNNTALYDDDDLMVRAYGGGSSINEQTTPGFFKFIQNLDEPDASEYEDSGFLLEFELYDRFDDEISGFISTKGQQIVCKYPEYATYNEILFVMNKWNTAEALMYNKNSTYEELDVVIDVESFARMYLIQELTKNLDGGATSYYVYYDGGKFHAGVAWDYDWTLGQYRKDYPDRADTASSVFKLDIKTNPGDYEGWYLNSKKIYNNSSTLNAQAALCQNDAFWGVVTAEWKENFYPEALEFSDGTVSGVAELDGIIGEFYNQVKGTTYMDDIKWNLLTKDPFYNSNVDNSWGSADTGDTHDDAVVWLNNWYYNRLSWMNGKFNDTTLSYYEDYTLQAPTLTPDSEVYSMGDNAVLTAQTKSGGEFTYVFYKNGEQVQSSDSAEYEFTVGSAADVYTVKVVSKNAIGKESAVSEAAEFTVEGLTSLELTVTAPESAGWNDRFYVTGTTNADADYDVKYSFWYAGDELEGFEVPGGKNGEYQIRFELSVLETGFVDLTVKAEVTLPDGTVLTDEETVRVTMTDYTLSATLSAPQSVETGMNINLSASPAFGTAAEYTYEFYNAEDDTLLGTNTTGMYSQATTNADIGKSYSYYAKVTAVAKDWENKTKTYTCTTATVTVEVTDVKEAYNVTVYFKSTGTYGYKPSLTTTGTVEEVENAPMTKDVFIGKNETQTASYFWYKTEVTVSKAVGKLEVEVRYSRYAQHSSVTLDVTGDSTFYLAVDDLNSGGEIQNLSTWPEDMRNWCKSAVHMVFDEACDNKPELIEISANFANAKMGDANNDGLVNIKDTSYIQKALAQMVELDSTGKVVADVDDDGVVTIKDAAVIQKRLAGL